jgi:hypothetical protein
MERTAVVSKMGMSGFAYDPENQMLEIAFVSRKEGMPESVYHYTPVTAEDWKAFQEAESKGSHFLHAVKPRFICTKVTPVDGDAKSGK